MATAAQPATRMATAVYDPRVQAAAPLPVVMDAYVVDHTVPTGGRAVTTKDGGHSITDEESGSDSGDNTRASANDNKYCYGQLSLSGLIVVILACLAVIAVPIALVKKNDVFTTSNVNEPATGQCRSPRCLTDEDCAFSNFGAVADNTTTGPTGQCYHALLRCSNEKNLMTDFCPCLRDSDCVSGRCEGFAVGFSKCAPLLDDGSYCNEASDCESNRCDRAEPGKAPTCMAKITETCGVCNEDTDCASGECDYLLGRCRNNNGFDVVVDASTAMNTLDEGCACLTAKDCMTGRCDFAKNNPVGGRVCRLKEPSCGGCNENSDCASNDCLESVFRCRNENGLMDDECNCMTNGDCESQRCEALSLNPLDGFFCFPKHADCQPCNEDSDCESGKCNLINLMCGDETGNIFDCYQSGGSGN